MRDRRVCRTGVLVFFKQSKGDDGGVCACVSEVLVQKEKCQLAPKQREQRTGLGFWNRTR